MFNDKSIIIDGTGSFGKHCIQTHVMQFTARKTKAGLADLAAYSVFPVSTADVRL